MKKYIYYLACIVVSFSVGWFSHQSNIETKSQSTKVEESHKTVVTETEEHINKDGSVTRSIKKTELEDSKSLSKMTSSSKLTNALPSLLLSGSYNLNNNVYGLGLQKRVFSAIYIGGNVTFETHPEVTAVLSIGF